jgi:hydrogenase maturation protease
VRAVVIGYGNRLRGDDGVGPAVAEALDAVGIAALAVPQLTPELAAVLAEVEVAVFVDASAGPMVEAIEVVVVRAAERAAVMGHVSDPAGLLALTAMVYGRCPTAWLVRVAAESFEIGDMLSPRARRGMTAALGAVECLLWEER